MVTVMNIILNSNVMFHHSLSILLRILPKADSNLFLTLNFCLKYDLVTSKVEAYIETKVF